MRVKSIFMNLYKKKQSVNYSINQQYVNSYSLLCCSRRLWTFKSAKLPVLLSVSDCGVCLSVLLFVVSVCVWRLLFCLWCIFANEFYLFVNLFIYFFF